MNKIASNVDRTDETSDSPGRILLVDQDENMISLLTDLLKEVGYQSTSVRSGREAIRMLMIEQFDLLIAEIQMSGYEKLELVLAAHRYAEGMPVILYTSNPSLETAISSIQFDVSAYLTKPIEYGTLLTQVKVNIANYRAFKRRGKLLEQSVTYLWAIEETIRVLESTRSSFRSIKLAALRRKLERLLDTGRFF
jgi:DNA-binding NtrC family response regulator